MRFIIMYALRVVKKFSYVKLQTHLDSLFNILISPNGKRDSSAATAVKTLTLHQIRPRPSRG